MLSPDFDLGLVTSGTKLEAKVMEGDDLHAAAKTRVIEGIVTVEEILGPLTPKDVPILRCVGLNYVKHSEHNSSFVKRQRVFALATSAKPMDYGS